jgi:hypothetical protein
MTCETAAMLRGRFRVITNENFTSDKPVQNSGEPVQNETKLAIVDDSVSNDAALNFKTWLESEYHRNKTPFQFDNSVVVEVVDYPEDGIVNRTIALMHSNGWSVSVVEHECAGGRAASVTLCPPHSSARKS